MKKLVTYVVALPVVALVIGPMALLFGAWQGFFLSIMWGWFVVPLGMPVLTVPHACGLSGIYFLLSSRNSQDSDSDKALLRCIVGPPIACGVAWMFKLWMGV